MRLNRLLSSYVGLTRAIILFDDQLAPLKVLPTQIFDAFDVFDVCLRGEHAELRKQQKAFSRFRGCRQIKSS